MKKRHKTLFVLLVCAAWIALNVPMLLIADIPRLLWGVPLFYWYIFAVWIVMIILTRALLRRYVQ